MMRLPRLRSDSRRERAALRRRLQARAALPEPLIVASAASAARSPRAPHAELELVRACLARQPHAMREVQAQLDEVLLAMLQEHPAASREAICARQREHILRGSAQRGPKLADYAGTGQLKTWLKVVVARALLQEGALR